MPLILPDFTGRKCLEASFCGHVLPEEVSGIELPQPIEDLLVARYEKSGQEVLFGLLPPYPGKNAHVHLNLSVPERFSKLPFEVNSSTDVILDLLRPLLGKKVVVQLTGLFRVRKDVLPPFIRATFVVSVADNIEVSMTEATLSVRGTPIHTIHWALTRKGDATVELEARTQLEFDGSYLDQGLDLLESAFRAFIIKEPSDG